MASGTAGELDGYFRFTAIAPTTLNPGTDYVVGSYISGELGTALFGGNGTVDSNINVIDVRYSPFGSAAFEFPGLTDPGTDGAAFLGANIRGSASPVPLPAAVWLFGSGVAGLVGLARRRARMNQDGSL
ncbi:MAG: VPLPA-CTERM sorting domain-containing protein [Nitrospira sp.]|nr:VPLPA-CTERM sorting domain-containing protein [Nitrospira sp.]